MAAGGPALKLQPPCDKVEAALSAKLASYKGQIPGLASGPSVLFCGYNMVVSIGELRRFLRAQGCTFEESRKHTMVRLGVRSAMMPRHPSKEIADGTLNAILKQLGLKGK
jgi:mRNA interferase HicA